MADSTTLKPGDTLLRREVHAIFGGRTQGGIGPSSKTPTVLFFTDAVAGHRHGYTDGWDDDGLFNYTGEGQRGDQRLVQGNKAIVNHAADGRTLKGFTAVGSTVTFMGDFELVDYHWADARDTDGVMRQVVVFRLRPLAESTKVALVIPQSLVTVSAEDRTKTVPVEDQHTERAVASPSREPYEYERREATLVLRYADHLRRSGHEVGRLCVVPAGEPAPIYSDLWDQTGNELIEAKGLVTREQLRMAVGQLLDYRRFVDHSRLAILVPTRPRPDLLRYLASLDIDAIYADGDGWARN
jgi:hypothetical protein